MNIQGWFPLGLTGLISLKSKELSRSLQHDNSKESIIWHSTFFIVQIWHSQMTARKTIALTTWNFVGKVMPLLFNTLSTCVISCLPMSKHLSISWLWSPFAMILKPKKIKSVIVSPFSLSICNKVMGTDAMILVFWMLSYKPAFSFSSFILIKKFFSSFSLSAIREALHVND